MALPININQLINGKIVEWDRIEFKKGWNPKDVLHTTCAYANDINNWGGGYIVIGVEEKTGIPVLPPVGLQQNQIDPIQKKIVEICNLIEPKFFPVMEPTLFQGKNILIIWVPGGDNRPYKAPTDLVKNSPKAYFVRRGSITTKAAIGEEKKLFESGI